MRSKELRDLIRKEIVAALREQKTPEEIAADKAEVMAAQLAKKAAEAKLKKAQEKAAQKEETIKLKDLLEQEEEEEGDANPFAGSDDKGGEDAAEEEGGEEAAADKGGEEGAEKDGEEEADPEMPKKDDITVNFNIGRVKRYNDDKRFRGSQGVVKKVTKDGMMLTVVPDGVDIFVNFDDIE